MQRKVAVEIDSYNGSIGIDLGRESCGRTRKINPAIHLVAEKKSVLIKGGIAKAADDITIIVHSYEGAAQDISGHVDWLEGALPEHEIVNKTGAV